MLKLLFRIDSVREVFVMTYQEQFNRWLASAGEDPDLTRELEGKTCCAFCDKELA